MCVLFHASRGPLVSHRSEREWNLCRAENCEQRFPFIYYRAEKEVKKESLFRGVITEQIRDHQKCRSSRKLLFFFVVAVVSFRGRADKKALQNPSLKMLKFFSIPSAKKGQQELLRIYHILLLRTKGASNHLHLRKKKVRD